MTVEGKTIRLNLWDSALDSPNYFNNADMCLLVYDVTNQQSFDSLRQWLDRLIESTPDNITPRFALVGNKRTSQREQAVCDTKEQVCTDSVVWFLQKVSLDTAVQFYKENDSSKGEPLVWEVSATEGNGISECFNELAAAIVKHRNTRRKQSEHIVDITHNLNTGHLLPTARNVAMLHIELTHCCVAFQQTSRHGNLLKVHSPHKKNSQILLHGAKRHLKAQTRKVLPLLLALDAGLAMEVSKHNYPSLALVKTSRQKAPVVLEVPTRGFHEADQIAA